MNHEIEMRKRRKRWDKIDWSPPLRDHFVFPEDYFRFDHSDFLDHSQRVDLNHLAVCYSCEQAIHFERYVIEYIGRARDRLSFIPASLLQRFIDEEEVHIGAFHQVLEKVRPDLYPTRNLRFLDWNFIDELWIRMTPLASFFLLAMLLEEITIFIPVAMDEKPEESFSPVHAVMRLHAQEERGHVAIDARILEHLQKEASGVSMIFQVLFCLPLLIYVDVQIKRAWRRTVDQFLLDTGLDPKLRARLLKKKPPRADILGIQSFIRKMRTSTLRGSGMLCSILERQIA